MPVEDRIKLLEEAHEVIEELHEFEEENDLRQIWDREIPESELAPTKFIRYGDEWLERKEVFLEPQEGNTEHKDRIKDGQRLLRRERDRRNRTGPDGDTNVDGIGINMSNMGSPYKRNNTPRKKIANSSGKKKGKKGDRYTEVV